MATSWSEIISDSAMVFIDDVRLQEECALSPAMFFRRMSLYMTLAIPLMSRPPALLTMLQSGLQEAEFTDSEWTSTADSMTEQTTVDTGNVGYDLFSCVIRNEDENGNVSLIPYGGATYDAETGNVVFPIQGEQGVVFQLDFFKDGQFENDLTATQKRLLGMAVAVCWDERFTRNWLNMQQKIHDSSFDVVNESTYIEKTTNRLSKTRSNFFAELWKYEQDCAYNKTLPNSQKNAWKLI